MGRARRIVPAKLPQKLQEIRLRLGLSLEEMIARLDYPQLPLYRSSIYRYESGSLEPSLQIILRYARLIDVSTDVLIDDDLELPQSGITNKNNQKKLELL